jgi:isopenicillin-N epimerase
VSGTVFVTTNCFFYRYFPTFYESLVRTFCTFNIKNPVFSDKNCSLQFKKTGDENGPRHRFHLREFKPAARRLRFSPALQYNGIMISPPSPLGADLRSLWMLKPGFCFLNHGSFGAMPRIVFDAQTRLRERIEADPIEMIGRRSGGLIDHAKIPIGELLGMKPADFGFVTNATDGVNAVLRSLTLKPGDELLTTNHVYFAVKQAMALIARNAGATCRDVEIPLPVHSSADIRVAVLNAISPRTKLLVIDHVTSPTALVFPLKEIVAGCREKGVAVLADGAHAPGMLPLDVEAIAADYYVGNLHKWICAPKGAAFLWVSPRHQSQVHPTVISHHLDQGFAKEFSWQGTRDLSAWLAVPTAIEFLHSLGFDKVLAHNHQLATWAQQLLSQQWNVDPISPIDGSLLGSMATIPLPSSLNQLDGPALIAMQQRLHDEFQIENPIVRWDGRTHLRVSCQVYNQPAEYLKVAATIKTIREES